MGSRPWHAMHLLKLNLFGLVWNGFSFSLEKIESHSKREVYRQLLSLIAIVVVNCVSYH